MRKDTLTKLYVTRELWIAEIAEDKEIAYEEVVRQLKHHGIKLRNPKSTEEWHPDWLHIQYWEKGRTLTSIGEEQGVTSATVLSTMANFGIPRRKKGARSSTAHTKILDATDVVLIRRLAAEGVKQSKIRVILAEGGKHVTKQALSKVVRGETWKDVVDEGPAALSS